MEGLLIEIEAESEEEAFDKAVDTLNNMTEEDIVRTYTNNRKIKLAECFDDPDIFAANNHATHVRHRKH